MGRDIGDELFRPMARELGDLNVRMAPASDVIRGLRHKKREDRDGVDEVDRYDGDGSDGSGTPPRTPNNPNNGSDGDSPPLPSPASQHQARVEAGNASEPDWHRVTTGHHGPPPPDMDAAHGHHIVFKKGVGRRQQEVLAEAKAILDKHGINWYTGSENLIWAPNVAGQHTIANVREVLKRLQEADGQGSEAVAEALRLAGRELFGGKP